MEVYVGEDFANTVIEAAKEFNIQAQIIGRVEASNKKELVIKTKNEKLVFD